jgi:hypothetical protein
MKTQYRRLGTQLQDALQQLAKYTRRGGNYWEELDKFLDAVIAIGAVIRVENEEINDVVLKDLAQKFGVFQLSLQRICEITEKRNKEELLALIQETGVIVRDLEELVEVVRKADGKYIRRAQLNQQIDRLVGQAEEFATMIGDWDWFKNFLGNTISLCASKLPDDTIGLSEHFKERMPCVACGLEAPEGGWSMHRRYLLGRNIEVALCPECLRNASTPRLGIFLLYLLDYTKFLEQYVLSLRYQVSLKELYNDFRASFAESEDGFVE